MHHHQAQSHHGLHQSHLQQLHHQSQQHNSLSPQEDQELTNKHRHITTEEQQQTCKWSNGLQQHQQSANFANHHGGDTGTTMAEVWQPYHGNETNSRREFLHHRYHHRHSNHQFLHQHFSEHYRTMLPSQHGEQNHHQALSNNSSLYSAQ